MKVCRPESYGYNNGQTVLFEKGYDIFYYAHPKSKSRSDSLFNQGKKINLANTVIAAIEEMLAREGDMEEDYLIYLISAEWVSERMRGSGEIYQIYSNDYLIVKVWPNFGPHKIDQEILAAFAKMLLFKKIWPNDVPEEVVEQMRTKDFEC